MSRWMVLRTPPQNIARYLVKAITLRDLIINCQDGFVYLIDVDAENRTRGTFFLGTASLPDDYVPTERSYYDAEAELSTEAEQQDIFINDDLAVQKVWEIRRKYSQTYNFLALFGPNGRPQELPNEKIRYKMKGGWVRHTLFSVLASYVKTEMRVSLAEVAAASPGYVRFRVQPRIASDLRDAITDYRKPDTRRQSERTAELLKEWLRENEKGMSATSARRLFHELCAPFGIKSESLLDHADMDVAINTVTGYFNRLAYFDSEETEQSSMLVGLKR